MRLLKKKRVYISFIILFLICVTYIIIDRTNIEEVQSDSSHVLFNSPAELFNNSDLVIEAVASGNTKNVTQEVYGYPEGYTLTSVKVKQVLKNDKKIDIGKYFEVAEPYFIWDKGLFPGKQKITYEGYTELQEDASYILFLKWGEGINGYWINSLEQGKYNLDGKDLKEEEVWKRKEQYRALKNEIIEEFNEQ